LMPPRKDVATCERPARSVMGEEGVARSGHAGSRPPRPDATATP
jgi:hypothetical protein